MRCLVIFFLHFTGKLARDYGLGRGCGNLPADSDSSSQLSKLDPMCGFLRAMTAPPSISASRAPTLLLAMSRPITRLSSRGNPFSHSRTGSRPAADLQNTRGMGSRLSGI